MQKLDFSQERYIDKMIFFALSVFSVATFGSLAKEIELPICKRNSTDYSVCLTHAIQEAYPLFIEGIPEYDLPRLDPLVYKYGKGVFDSDILHAEITFSNVTGIGLKKIRFFIANAYFVDDVFHLEVSGQIPILFINGNCSADGILGGFRLNSKGHFNITAEDIRSTWKATGHVVKDRLIVEHFLNTLTFEKMKFYTEDLFGDSKEISDLAVSFVNEYWPLLYRVALPVATKAWDPWLTDLCNHFFSKVSFSLLFPEN